MEDVGIDLEVGAAVVSPKEFITEVYEMVRLKAKRNPRRADFYFEMIPRMGGELWWMSPDHPAALMLAEGEIVPKGEFSGPLGKVVVYESTHVRACVDAIIEYCNTFELVIDKSE